MRSGGKLGLFLEMQQGSQTSLSVATGNSEFRSSRCHGISPYDELRGPPCPFDLNQGLWGSSQVSTNETSNASSVSGTSGFLSNPRLRIGPYLEMIWGTRSSSRVLVLTSVFI